MPSKAKHRFPKDKDKGQVKLQYKQDESKSSADGHTQDHGRRKRKTSGNDDDPDQGFSLGYPILLTLSAVMLVVVGVVYVYWMHELRERVRRPLNSPLIVPVNATSAAVAPEKYWGSYRPHAYFGLKTRSPKSPVFGLMWFTQFLGERPPAVRHWCDHGDGMLRYGWLAHDATNFGVQEIIDRTVTLRTEYLKKPGGDHGGDWTAKISATPVPAPGGETMVVSLLFYAALDGPGSLQPTVEKKRTMTVVSGHTAETGSFKLYFPTPGKNVKATDYLLANATGLNKLKEAVMAGMRMAPWGDDKTKSYIGLGGRLLPDGITSPNLVVHQVTVALPFHMEVIYESGSKTRETTLSGSVYDVELSKQRIIFEKKFESIFELQDKGYNPEDKAAAKNALSNMLGGIGYFYGASKVQSSYNKEPLDYRSAPLYTAVPSRSFFPRGFLWDEGFHNLLIMEWDPEISKEIIGHWLDLINKEGWIPREQILGVEARAKVPDEFVVQKNENANPPTLFLPLQKLVKQLSKSDDPKDLEYLRNIYPRLRIWYRWFNETQAGPKPLTYRWRGRDSNTKRELNPKTLTSGLDDYPRASHPTDAERHVDLRCWMALASGIMADIGKTIGEPWEDYQATHDLLTDNKLLDEHHWSEKAQMYSDFGLHTDHTKLVRPKPPKNLAPGQRPPPQQQMEKERQVKSQPKLSYVNSFGYVSLFPFLLQIVDPNSPKLDKILTDLKDPNLLWTRFGLRSLARNAPLYRKHNTEHDPPYWRGNIWINMNYLAIRALHHYSNTEGPYKTKAKEIYKELRDNVVKNIVNEYKRTGYVWENYDDSTGEGKGTHPFTGWSALFVLIMAEKY
ncbi:mannosyl-oligosaccharide glucosidase [Lingula anatina]|uniref:Mannosyl-oligosaccharide glucosidase n=1 Tax=Lingula anatina TaxID=7574 RepID=A0A1S3HWL5_LINAN|nr:mannosyl-oligosaccharide glucosidase [Lingula anatina]|eukprot:XP_013390408.1 mannosyl-oligosaccharide glucosidase [Lingula anatina]